MTTPAHFGSEFLVNPSLEGSTPSVAALADGRFVVTWAYTERLSDLRAQVFNADGTELGSDFRINKTISGHQYDSSITALVDGRFVVTWSCDSVNGGDTHGSAVRAQVFSADGTKSGSEFLVNTTTFADQQEPSITALVNGNFVVTWTDLSSSDEDTDGAAVRAQVFTADGRKLGSEFIVNTVIEGWQEDASITALAEGNFLVSWTAGSKSGGDASGQSVRAQVFNADGSKAGAEFLVNTTSLGSQNDSSVTTLADGRFVVSWTDREPSGGDLSDAAVRAQVFTADGSKFGSEFLVNATTEGWQSQSTVTALADGRFVVTWSDGSNFFFTGSEVRAQVFNADGTKSGSEFLVNTKISQWQNDPSITALADGRFVVSWTDDNWSVRAQIFDPRESAVELDGTLGNDHFIGTTFGDSMRGSHGSDLLNGQAGDDTLRGEQGEDVLNGGVGRDLLIGGEGDDTFVVDRASDRVREATDGGIDTVLSRNQSLYLGRLANLENATVLGTAALSVTGNSAANLLTGNDGDNVITGRSGDDILVGNGGTDSLIGGEGADTLEGGEEEDRLDGGAGDDVMTGGTGGDVFVFAPGHNTSRVLDFGDDIDKIDLSAYGFTSESAALAFALDVSGSVVFTFAAGEVLTIDNMTKAQLTEAEFIL